MSNRSVVAQLCLIGAIVPMWLFATRALSGVHESDFLVLWEAGRAALDGRPVYVSSFSYPPHSLLLFAPFAILPPALSELLFNSAGVAFFAWAARPYLPRGFPPIAIASPALLLCLYFGQTGLIVGGLWLLAFRGFPAAVALLSFKPHLGVLGLLSLSDWSSLFRAALVGALLVLASALLFGASVWHDFLLAVARQALAIGVNGKWPVIGVSPAIGYGFWGWLPFAISAVLMLARRVTPFTAATASLLISPYGFHYDMAVACLGFALAIHSGWRQATLAQRSALALGYLAPALVYLGTWWIPPLLLWALWVQTSGTIEEAPRIGAPRARDSGAESGGKSGE